MHYANVALRCQNDRRIRRLIEQDQDYLDRAVERERRRVDLRLPGLSDDYWPRDIGRSRSSESLDRAYRRSRSPRLLSYGNDDLYATRRTALYLDDVPYDDSLRESRLERRFREIGPAAYIEDITTRDSLRDPRLSRPRLRDLSV